ncbi:SMI1/KNR4 family protein [Actinoplanes oblitus]|uniref:SMI1/KNR4 family protein n=1 Tax=Actinoplanes oblitus TaxID=3040509 RepID=A0ABY8WTI4_9ACTN|nr:SMI1/KNR4 family protein [Actinoplanes oblitus]WIN00123.1 SMI1/KNR4 family protein [Actinoplanes oblitus]
MTGSDWGALLPHEEHIKLQRPASHDDLARVETSLKAALPAELRALYLVSNGVFNEAGQWFVVWPLAEVIERNQSSWDGWEKQSVDRRQLLGFGDDGTGDPFCVPRDGSTGVFV